MDEQQTELVAIGASVTANCIPCLSFHVGKARDAGASEDQIAEAIRIGRKVRAGAAKTWDEAASDLVHGSKP